MPITLAIQTSNGDFCPTPYALLDDELAAYLGDLSQLPALRSLADLDAYESVTLPRALYERLAFEARRLSSFVDEEALPTPPAFVGMEGTGDPKAGEPFGWEGLSKFATDLTRVLETALHQNASLVAIGD